jgi:hypothetical protein
VEVGRSYDLAVPICSQAVLWSEGNVLDKGTTWWLATMGRAEWNPDRRSGLLGFKDPSGVAGGLQAGHTAMNSDAAGRRLGGGSRSTATERSQPQ